MGGAGARGDCPLAPAGFCFACARSALDATVSDAQRAEPGGGRGGAEGLGVGGEGVARSAGARRGTSGRRGAGLDHEGEVKAVELHIE